MRRQIMTVTNFGLAVLFAGAICLAVGHGSAQNKSSSESTSMTNTRNPMAGMVFCDKMQTGELCPEGTMNTLKLSGEAAKRWEADVHEYNKAIEAANMHLLAEGRHTLTPQQYSEVKLWFAKGLNPLMNRLLADQGRLPK